MSIKIGHARGGDPTYTPGDQTGNEVKVANWYNHPWNFVARFKDRAKAERAVKFCEDACANRHIGYGQGDRNTLRPLARAAGWDAAKISKDCNCDCTSFASVCAEAGGVNMDGAYSGGNAPYSENIRAKLAGTGEFEILTDPKYLNSDAYLLRGDILVNEPLVTGHAVMALSNGSMAATELASKPSTTPAAPAATTPAVSTPAAAKQDEPQNDAAEWVHTVQPGDTLWGIAQKYGTTVEAICEANNLDIALYGGMRPARYIFPGQTFKIPGGRS